MMLQGQTSPGPRRRQLPDRSSQSRTSQGGRAMTTGRKMQGTHVVTREEAHWQVPVKVTLPLPRQECRQAGQCSQSSRGTILRGFTFHSICFWFFLLRYNLHTVACNPFECVVQQVWQTHTAHVSLPQPTYRTAPAPRISSAFHTQPSPQPSLWKPLIYSLFYRFTFSRIIQYIGFYDFHFG